MIYYKFMVKIDDSTKIKELLEIINHKVDSLDLKQTGQSASISLMRDQLSVMNKKIDGVTDRLDDPDTGLAAINKRLDHPKTGLVRINERLDALWDQAVKLTEDVSENQETLDSHSMAFKLITANTQNSKDNFRKVAKRLDLLEEDSGVEVSHDLKLADVV
jgi:chromosome segregation ATPase